MHNQRIAYLLEQFFQQKITHQEQEELKQLLADHQNEIPLEDWLKEKWASYQADGAMPAQQADHYFQQITNATTDPTEEESPGTQPGWLNSITNNWKKIAAAIIIAASTYLVYTTTNSPAPQQPQQSTNTIKEDVGPGGNFATLTLGDGSKIVLDTASNGLLANQGNASIVKLNNGEISYKAKPAKEEVVHHTMSTPIGGQYHLVLPDGTGVWLNAASSITYPTAFTAPERQVSITGEVYFEVAKNAEQPFRVTVGDQKIEVLGTHFNVNAYDDERTLNTTLVEGKVKIINADQAMLLAPGQQIQNNKTGKLKLVKDPDLEETLAWKDGLFHFNGTDIETIMRNVARWYGVEVVYKDKIEEQFVADIPRNVNVSKLLELLELTRQVHFSVNNKVITVTKP